MRRRHLALWWLLHATCCVADDWVVPFDEARDMLAETVLRTLADRKVSVVEAVEFCQRALRDHDTVMPGFTTDGLSEDDQRRWGWFDCKNQFCTKDNVPGCIRSAYGRRIDDVLQRPSKCGVGTAKVTLFTTMPFIAKPAVMNMSKHFFETLIALGENARSPEIQRVHVVVDRLLEETSEDTLSEFLRKAITQQQERYRTFLGGDFALTSEEDLEKVDVAVYGSQPTYADMFRYANKNLTNSLVALTNADVVLRNLNRIDPDAFLPQPHQRRLALTLAVHPPNGTYSRMCKPTLRCVRGQGSWDTHLFFSPLPDDARWEWLEDVQPNPVYMNMIGAENRVGIFLHASGYDLRNPCHDIIAEHWHCSPKTHHTNVAVWDWISTPHLRLPGHVVDPSHSDRGIFEEC